MALKRGRRSLREIKEANNRADAFIAAMHGVAPKAQNEIGPKRERVVRGSPERKVNDKIAAAAKTFANVHLWRNNRGVAQMGERVVRYGVGPNGAGDWIGYKRIIIRQEDVGREMAQFISIEAKAPGSYPNPEQRVFIANVCSEGGIAGVVRNETDLLDLLRRK